ncbi:carbohydrate ABC transporter permease [Paenibacillus sacheonensis]|uniref:ABC transporter permease subunit n=1 Tax=Paenibacillus sacheonensis TaxID=742054 RepID=A0A7X5BXL3_9BACL|nr:carbohydrate ABC transporter permease [Paenibacillus sacheonensis]MBM7566656.1 multiple sugar transport system permease protein [Paenibacillus sacheonensis]NBC70638.1 ABC transporter permease subunit [Paenibacillus sacheonensis]
MVKKSVTIPVSVVMVFVSLAMLVPFLMMVLTSLKTMDEIFAPHFVWIPDKWQWSNYKEAFSQGDWGRYYFNTTYVTVVTVVLSLLINSFAGYAFAKLNFKGRDLLFFISLVGLMIPPQVTMIPVFIILKHIPLAGGNDWVGHGGLGWIDSYNGLIAPYVAGSFGVFLFRQFFLQIPKELDDAAKIDGMGRVRAFFNIYVPLSKPVFATLIALKAVASWNEYTWPLIITSSEHMKTVQLALTVFRDENQTQWNLMMASTTIMVLPLLVLFVFTQRYFIEGIVSTGVKG